MKRRRLFCEISPFTYRLSVCKGRMIRHIQDALFFKHCAKEKRESLLPVVVYAHKSIMRRRLGNVDMRLQENKAANLNLAAPRVSGIVIKPGKTFSFWKLVGPCGAAKGYKEGLMISGGKTRAGVGGGMCQFTNLIHWLVLHTPLDITEHHHHDGLDLFPDCGREVPFGTGTSIMYNYFDYRFQNNTDQEYQLIVTTTDEYLCGEIRTSAPLPFTYRVEAENERFVRLGDKVYRMGKVYRTCIDKTSGAVLQKELIKENRAEVLYDTSALEVVTGEPSPV